jgi:hypothetical protein
MMIEPKKLIIIGFFLVLFGAVGPWLMILDFIRSTLFFNFLVYGSSIAGLVCGILGAAMMSQMRKDK